MDTFPPPLLVVTIDGPAASGKGTAARGLAARLGCDYLDTGTMYRAVALHLLDRGVSVDDPAAVEARLPDIRIDALNDAVRLNGRDVTATVRDQRVADGASRVAVIPAVRRHLIAEQRRTAAGRRIVCDGRDQGTVVFPDAAVKFYLTAGLEVRAARRHAEPAARGRTLDQIRDDLRARDERDRGHGRGPAADAVPIQSDELTAEQVVERMAREVADRCPTDPR